MTKTATLESLDERVSQIEAWVSREVGSERPRDSLAPAPDYAIERPASGEPRPCGCEEAVALRARVAELEGIVDALTAAETRLQTDVHVLRMERDNAESSEAAEKIKREVFAPLERAVLDAMRAVAKDELLLMAQGVWCGHGQDAAVAELARREGK